MLNLTAARRNNRSVAELNIAPLIDMVFILLIFFLVTTSFVKETGIDVNRPTALTAVSQTKATILVGIDKRILGSISISDSVRPESAPAIAELKSLGVEHAVLITGDTPAGE